MQDIREIWSKTKNVFEIHNLAYQGEWFENILDFANMRKDIVYNEWGCEHYGRVNWMKGAINYSDRIVAVSPKYAEEILTGEFGEGMDYTLRGNADKLVGILNGIDYKVFNPKTDKNLVKNYDVNSLKNKEENKKKILEYFGLKYNPERPLIALISRLVNQKGIDLIRDVENDLRHLPADFIFLGSGDASYENLFIWLSNNTSNIRTYVGYKGDLANQIYAGSDFFLMPSKFEPCGLSQLIAMRYGSLPIVRATGGLENTVVGYPLDNSTGFKFWRYDGWDMKEAINCAIGVYKDKYTFNAMRKSAMESDFSWKKSSEIYLNMYKELVGQMQELSMRNYAHIGDAVWELFVRKYTVYKTQNSKLLHNMTTERVKAGFQAKYLDLIQDELTEVEHEIARRARSASIPVATCHNQSEYRLSTAFEALLGYWYLNDKGRLNYFFEKFKQMKEFI